MRNGAAVRGGRNWEPGGLVPLCVLILPHSRKRCVYCEQARGRSLAGAELNPGAKAPSGRCTWGLGLASALPRVPAGLSCPSSPAIIKIRS